MSADEAKGLSGVLFDLDDTLLDHGVLTESAYSALWALSRGGLRLFAVTGRPWGWVDVVARQWPIDGATAENGAVGLYREAGTLRRWDPVDESTRRGRRVRLARVLEDLRARFGTLRLSDDTYARVSDVALDIGETQTMPDDAVSALVAAARELGVMTFVSTVHLHLTLDAVDKASGTLALLHRVTGEPPDQAKARYAFLGDSPNDAACFGAFETTVGVKNVEPFVECMGVSPRYVASAERGAGFAEIARRILELRR